MRILIEYNEKTGDVKLQMKGNKTVAIAVLEIVKRGIIRDIVKEGYGGIPGLDVTKLR